MAKLQVVLELFQVQAAPGLDIQSAKLFPAEKELIHQSIPPEIIARLDWGGHLVDRNHESRGIALQIVGAARRMAESLQIEKLTDDQSDFSWGHGGILLKQLFGTEDLNILLKSFFTIASRCQSILKEQDTLIKVPAPCKIFGDIHGQVLHRSHQNQPAIIDSRRPSFATSSSSSACSASPAIAVATSSPSATSSMATGSTAAPTRRCCYLFAPLPLLIPSVLKVLMLVVVAAALLMSLLILLLLLLLLTAAIAAGAAAAAAAAPDRLLLLLHHHHHHHLLLLLPLFTAAAAAAAAATEPE